MDLLVCRVFHNFFFNFDYFFFGRSCFNDNVRPWKCFIVFEMALKMRWHCMKKVIYQSKKEEAIPISSHNESFVAIETH